MREPLSESNAFLKPDGTPMTFLELLESGEEIDCGLAIADVDMPADLYWDENCGLTDYGKEAYRELMASHFVRLESGNLYILCSNEKMGNHFSLAAAGYIGESEYQKLFTY